ncbi:MAG: hypothetical protein ACQEQV_06950 [Fibrobacterota bacterium]
MFFKEADSAQSPITLLILIAAIIGIFTFRTEITETITDIFFKSTQTSSAPDESIRHFTDEEAKDAIRSFSGLWQHRGEKPAGGIFFQNLEIKENGYIYRYSRESFPLPGGDTAVIQWSREELLSPLYREDSMVTADIAILQEGYIFGDDSCLFQSDAAYDVGRLSKRDSARISFQGRTYTPYTDNLSEFFPGTAYDILKESDLYPKCLSMDTPWHDLRGEIRSALGDTEIPAEKAIKDFYIPACMHTLPLQRPDEDAPAYTLILEISGDGAVRTAEVTGPLAEIGRNAMLIREEAQQWHGLPAEAAKLTIQDTLR